MPAIVGPPLKHWQMLVCVLTKLAHACIYTAECCGDRTHEELYIDRRCDFTDLTVRKRAKPSLAQHR